MTLFIEVVCIKGHIIQLWLSSQSILCPPCDVACILCNCIFYDSFLVIWLWRAESTETVKEAHPMLLLWSGPFSSTRINFWGVNPFLFIQNKRLFISSEGISAVEKNAVICYQRTVLPIQSSVTALADGNGRLAHFFKNLNLLGWAWQPAADGFL